MIREFVVRTLLLIDYLVSVPVFALLILVSPERYAASLAASGETIRARVLEYRKKG